MENARMAQMEKEIVEKDKLIWTSMWVIMATSIFAMCALLLFSALCIPEGEWQLVLILGSLIAFLAPCFYALKLEVSVGVYKCKKCGQKIVPTYGQALAAMHRGTTRYLSCPNCGRRTWCKKVIKKEAEK